MLTEATLDAAIELFSTVVVCNLSFSQFQVLEVLFEDVLNAAGSTVKRPQELFVPQAIGNKIFESDNTLRWAASTVPHQ